MKKKEIDDGERKLCKGRNKIERMIQRTEFYKKLEDLKKMEEDPEFKAQQILNILEGK